MDLKEYTPPIDPALRESFERILCEVNSLDWLISELNKEIDLCPDLKSYYISIINEARAMRDEKSKTIKEMFKSIAN
jgi:uncharacterized coiled-coil DUF342 family protein